MEKYLRIKGVFYFFFFLLIVMLQKSPPLDTFATDRVQVMFFQPFPWLLEVLDP